jgi:hypothetical protein
MTNPSRARKSRARGYFTQDPIDAQTKWLDIAEGVPRASLVRDDKPDVEWAGEQKKGNRSSVARKLALAGVGLHPAGSTEAPIEQADAILDANSECLDEAEDEGWREQRARAGWRYRAIRDDTKRLHHLIRLYAEFCGNEKEKHRARVRLYPELARRANCRIVIVYLHELPGVQT